LKRSGVRLALTNPDAAAIGKVSKEALGVEWDALAKQAAVMTATVNEVGTALETGSADAGFLWDSLMPQYPDFGSHSLRNLRAKTQRSVWPCYRARSKARQR